MIIYVYIMNENWDNENIELFLMSNKLVASKQTNVTLSMLISQIVSKNIFSHFQWYPDAVYLKILRQFDKIVSN